jgi:alkylation response protein AidB-like acyl-CoA dehydrogenase
MFHMMNEARIGVGLGAAVLGYTGYLHALDYARNRPQGRHPGAERSGPAATGDHRAHRRAAHAAGAEGLC